MWHCEISVDCADPLRKFDLLIDSRYCVDRQFEFFNRSLSDLQHSHQSHNQTITTPTNQISTKIQTNSDSIYEPPHQDPVASFPDACEYVLGGNIIVILPNDEGLITCEGEKPKWLVEWWPYSEHNTQKLVTEEQVCVVIDMIDWFDWWLIGLIDWVIDWIDWFTMIAGFAWLRCDWLKNW